MIRALAIAIVIAAGTASQAPDRLQDTVVAFETDKGTIEFEVDSARAPATAANFLRYVDGGFFDGGSVNRDGSARTTPSGATSRSRSSSSKSTRRGTARSFTDSAGAHLPTGLKHVDGTTSMARGGPDTATGSFSIVIGDQPEMDFGGRRNPDGQGFAAFGRVVRGMDVVKAIHASPTGTAGPYGSESLSPPIKILKVYRRHESPEPDPRHRRPHPCRHRVFFMTRPSR